MSDQKDNRSGKDKQGGGSGPGSGGDGPPQGFMSRGFMGWGDHGYCDGCDVGGAG